MNLYIKTEPVTAGADRTVYCMSGFYLHVIYLAQKPDIHYTVSSRRSARFLYGDSDYFWDSVLDSCLRLICSKPYIIQEEYYHIYLLTKHTVQSGQTVHIVFMSTEHKLQLAVWKKGSMLYVCIGIIFVL